MTPREAGAARARELKAQQPISPEQAAVVARLVLTGVPKKRGERDECPEGDAPAR